MSKQKDKDEEILQVLKEIKALLEPKPPPPPPPPPKGLWKEFLDFISKYKVMGMAVAFILGLYLGALVQALVNDINYANNNVNTTRRRVGSLYVGALPHRPLHRRLNNIPPRSLRGFPHSEDHQKMGN